MRGLIVFALLLPALGSAQPFDPTVMGENRRAQAERQRRGAIQGQRVINGIHRGFIVVLNEADHEARRRERRQRRPPAPRAHA